MDAVENGAPGQVIPRPPRWKTAVTVWLGLFPMLAVLNVTMMPRLRRLPLLVRPVPVSLVLVVWMTYLGLPLVGRLLRTWLRPVVRRDDR